MNDPLNQYFTQNHDHTSDVVRIGTCACTDPLPTPVFADLDELPAGMEVICSAGTRHNWTSFSLDGAISHIDPSNSKKRTPKWVLRDTLTNWNTLRSIAPEMEAIGRELVLYKRRGKEDDEEAGGDSVMVAVPAEKDTPVGLVASTFSLLQKLVVQHGERLRFDIPILCAMLLARPSTATMFKAVLTMLPQYFDCLPAFLRNPHLTESTIMLAENAWNSPRLAGSFGRMRSLVASAPQSIPRAVAEPAREPAPRSQRLLPSNTGMDELKETSDARRNRVRDGRQLRRHGC